MKDTEICAHNCRECEKFSTNSLGGSRDKDDGEENRDKTHHGGDVAAPNE